MDELAQVKDRTRQAWGAGDFRPFAQMIGTPGERLVERLEIRPGEAVLDVGCGTGNLAVRIARLGARVTGVDLTPEMIAGARAAGADAGVDVTWRQGDAEDLPAESGSMDVAISSFGCMFAPRHAVVAAELTRVLRPGGRMGILTWPVGSPIADFLGVGARHLPPPPAVAESPLLWGDEEHVRGLFEGTGVDLSFETANLALHFASAEDATAIYVAQFGPLVSARALLEPRGRWEPLADELAEFFERRTTPEGEGVVLRTDYMLILGRAAG